MNGGSGTTEAATKKEESCGGGLEADESGQEFLEVARAEVCMCVEGGEAGEGRRGRGGEGEGEEGKEGGREGKRGEAFVIPDLPSCWGFWAVGVLGEGLAGIRSLFVGFSVRPLSSNRLWKPTKKA